MKSISFVKNDLFPLLRLAIPLALAGIIQSSVFFFETLFLSHLGQAFLAAGALVNWLVGTIVVILFGTLSSINILIAHKHGAKDRNAIAMIVRDGFFLAILLAVPTMLLLWNMSPVFLLLGQSPEIVILAKSYLHAFAWGIFPSCIMIAFLEFLMGIGHARSIMIFSVISVLMSIFWSYTLIFGKFGLPALGISGAGYGMTVSYWTSAVMLAVYILNNKNYKEYFTHLFHFKKPYYVWELIQVGFPMGAMYCVEVGFFFALTLIMGSLGSQFLAANQIVMQYLGLLMAVIFSIAQAVTVRMGHLLGASDLISAKCAAQSGIFISAFFMIIAAFCYWVFPGTLISVDFNMHDLDNIELIRYTKQFFAIAAIFQILEAIRITLFGALRALKDTRFTLLTSIASFWCIALPLGYLLANYLRLGGGGMWWGMVVGVIFSVMLLHWRFKLKIK